MNRDNGDRRRRVKTARRVGIRRIEEKAPENGSTDSPRPSLPTFQRMGSAFNAFRDGKLPRGTRLVKNDDGFALACPIKDDFDHSFIEIDSDDLVRFLLKRADIKIQVLT
jgi:hypothetical protein